MSSITAAEQPQHQVRPPDPRPVRLERRHRPAGDERDRGAEQAGGRARSRLSSSHISDQADGSAADRADPAHPLRLRGSAGAGAEHAADVDVRVVERARRRLHVAHHRAGLDRHRDASARRSTTTGAISISGTAGSSSSSRAQKVRMPSRDQGDQRREAGQDRRAPVKTDRDRRDAAGGQPARAERRRQHRELAEEAGERRQPGEQQGAGGEAEAEHASWRRACRADARSPLRRARRRRGRRLPR